MRILVCSERDLVACVALNRLLPELEGHAVAVALLRYPSVDVASKNPLDRLSWFLRDLPDTEIFPALDRLDRPPGELMTFHHLSRRLGVPFHEIDSINTGYGNQIAREFRPDLILSVKFGQIFKEPVLSLPPLGILNTHSGALPQYAGLHAPMRTMLAGERQLTSTLHVADQGIDTGPVIASGNLPIDPARSLFWHLPPLYVLGVELFLQALPALAKSGKPASRPQDVTRRRYHGQPTAEEATVFEQRGYRLLAEPDYAEVIRRFGASWPPTSR